MGIIRFAIENPIKVAVGVILIVLFGGLSILNMPIQLTPDVDRPVITVSTLWPGASPQEIESEIIERQEDKLKNVTNLYKMTSSASQGQAEITLEFNVGVDKDVAYRDVSDGLRQVTGYPEEVDEPTIAASESGMERVIAWLILYGGPDRDVASLKTWVEDNVKPLLERAEGVSEVDVYGGLDREVQIEVDPQKLAARQLTFRDVERALRGQNLNVTAGTVAQGKRDYSYRTVGEYTSVEEVEHTVIANRAGGPIYIRDVAKVVDGFKKQYAFVRSKGQFVIAMPARRETGANVIEAMANLKRQIELVNKEVLAPLGQDLKLVQVYDETTYIHSAIDLVVNNLWVGGVLATVVLLLFLRSISATAIVAASIPISVVGTFLVLLGADRTINVVLLSGMAFAVGMVVDNSIVVLENIYRHCTMGKSAWQAAYDGTREVWGAVLASTLTTMAVFLPVVTIQEEAGQLFKDIAIAIAAAVGLSLFVSVVVIPPLAARYLRLGKMKSDSDKPSWFAMAVGTVVERVNRTVPRRLVLAGAVSVTAIYGSWLLMPGAEYMPAGNRNLVFGMIFTPPGYNIDEYKKMANIVEEGDPAEPYDGIRAFWEADRESADAAQLPDVQIRLGKNQDVIRTVKPPPIDNFFFVAFGSQAFMGCTSKDDNLVKPLEYAMNRATSRIPGAFAFFRQASLFTSSRGSSGNSVELEVRSDDSEAVVRAAAALQQEIMARGYDYPQANPANFDQGRPEFQLVPLRARAAEVGLNAEDIGFISEALVDGAFVGEFNDRGEKIDMALTVAGTHNATPQEFQQIQVYTPAGVLVPLAHVVAFNATTAPQQINHIEQMKAVTLTVTPKLGVPLQDTMAELEQEIIAPLREKGVVAGNVITSLAGEADKLTQTRHALIGSFAGLAQWPRLLGLGVSGSVGVILLLCLGGVAVLRLLGGARPALLALLILPPALLILFLAMNNALLLESLQSRAILALLITYLLMAALFESFAYPFVILLTVPLATVGGFAALRIVHEVSLFDVTAPIQQLDVVTMLGFVILIGVVVNNAILIVHQSLNFMRDEKLSHTEAVIKSVQTRTRPIFMTTMTTVFGLAPLVAFTGPGSELYRGIGSVMLGGLLVATFFTLVVIPVSFSLFIDARDWAIRVLGSGEVRPRELSAPEPHAGGRTAPSGAFK